MTAPIHGCRTEYVAQYLPAGGRQGWKVVCAVCGPLGKPPGYAYAQVGSARSVGTRHTDKHLKKPAA